MSLPRRIWLRKTGAGHVLCQEVVAPAAADLPDLRDASDPVPSAAHARMEGQRWRIVLEDGNGRALELERDGGVLRARRRDENHPFLDAVREVPLACQTPVDLWLDAGSIEVMADGGAVSLTLQHCFSGETIDCRSEA